MLWKYNLIYFLTYSNHAEIEKSRIKINYLCQFQLEENNFILLFSNMFCFIKGIADLISWSPTFCFRQYKCQRMLNQDDATLQIHSVNKDLLLRFNNATWVLRKLFKQFTKVWSFYLQLSAWVHVMLRQRTTILLPKGLLDNHLYTQYSLHEYSYGLTQCKIDYEVSTLTIILSRYVVTG